MPRKVKTEKPPLQFLERSLCGARVQNAPEVRAALNPRDFFRDRPDPDTTALSSWVGKVIHLNNVILTAAWLVVTVFMFQVSPQFQPSAAAAAPARRGRRRCQSATSILHSRNSVCKFPSLTFKSRLKNQPRQPQGTKTTAAQSSDTSKRHVTLVGRGDAVRCPEGAASSSRCLIQPEAPSDPVQQRGRTPATAASAQFSRFGPPPNVDAPDVIQDKCPSPSPLHVLLRCSGSPCNQPPDILVADTPERDYGLKVTWRRRKDLMTVMKERGHLSDSDVLIHSSYSELAR